MADNENSIQNSIDEPDILGLLTNSAFEFLEKAVDEFESSTKFSTIHFAISVELFLKARLVHEHWALILNEPEKTSRNDFHNGDFRSITWGQTMERLNAILGGFISKQHQEDFKKIFVHRNKMVHFVHSQLETEEQDKIALEQVKGWQALRILISNLMESGEESFGKLWEITVKMESHDAYRAYLDASASQDGTSILQ